MTDFKQIRDEATKKQLDCFISLFSDGWDACESELLRSHPIVLQMRDALDDAMDTIKREHGNCHPEFTTLWNALAAYSAAIGKVIICEDKK